MDCRVEPCNDGDWKGLRRQKERRARCLFGRTIQSAMTLSKSMLRCAHLPLTPSCHGSTMASMLCASQSQGLRVRRGHEMDCRVEPCNDGEWKGLRRQKERSAHCVLWAGHSVFDDAFNELVEMCSSPPHTVMPWLDHGIHAVRYPAARASGSPRSRIGLQGRALQRQRELSSSVSEGEEAMPRRFRVKVPGWARSCPFAGFPAALHRRDLRPPVRRRHLLPEWKPF